MAYPKSKMDIMSNVCHMGKELANADLAGSDGHKSVYRKDWLASSGQKVHPRSVERLGQVEYVS